VADFSLETPIAYLKGVGQQRAEILSKELGISTFLDLLYFFPFRYIDRTRFYKVNQIDPALSSVQILGRLIKLTALGEGRKRRLVGQLKDETGVVELIWFQSVRWLEKNLSVGSVYIVFGKASLFNNQLSISHPEMELYDPKVKRKGNQHLQPVYSSTEKLKKFSLDSKGIQHLVLNLLDSIYNTIPESLPNYVRENHSLILLLEALGAIHFPSD
jgi:ATP-dependent DNA helicase RecG